MYKQSDFKLSVPHFLLLLVDSLVLYIQIFNSCLQSEMLQEVKRHLQLAAKREKELSRHHATQEEVQLLSREREQLRQENKKVCTYIKYMYSTAVKLEQCLVSMCSVMK